MSDDDRDPVEMLRRVVARLDEMASPEGVDAINDLEDVAPDLIAVYEAARHACEESWDAERGEGWRDSVVDPEAWQALRGALDSLDSRIREVVGGDDA